MALARFEIHVDEASGNVRIFPLRCVHDNVEWSAHGSVLPLERVENMSARRFLAYIMGLVPRHEESKA